MQEYQLRVIDESKDLDEKIRKLNEFIQAEFFTQLDVNEQCRMKRQVAAMAEYSKVLHERIAAFSQ